MKGYSFDAKCNEKPASGKKRGSKTWKKGAAVLLTAVLSTGCARRLRAERPDDSHGDETHDGTVHHGEHDENSH